MTPLSSTSRSSPDHQSSTAHGDRPERSRNAKAQARHRAKRKAYIEQLEQTVTKLQYALAYTPEQIAALPPPLMRIRELEEKVGALVRENEELRRQVEQRNADLRPDIVRQPSYRTSFDDRHTDRGDIKRRRTIDHGELYVDQTQHQLPTPPPPLTIPPLSQQYARHERQQPQILSPYTTHLDYPLAETPSDTSTASSPSAQSFSASVRSLTPISEQYSASLHHRPSSSSSNQTVLPSFSNAVGPYSGLVKIEEDAYLQHHGMSTTNNYYTPTLPPVQHLTHWR